MLYALMFGAECLLPVAFLYHFFPNGHWLPHLREDRRFNFGRVRSQFDPPSSIFGLSWHEFGPHGTMAESHIDSIGCIRPAVTIDRREISGRNGRCSSVTHESGAIEIW